MYGFSLAFGGEGKFLGGFDKVFLAGITPDTLSATLATISGVCVRGLPVHLRSHHRGADRGCVCRAHQVLGRADLLRAVVHLQLHPHGAHGRGAVACWPRDGALDFAGGTVVHINAAVAGLVGAYMVGKRIGFGKEALPPHSLTLTMVGASLLWVGWFRLQRRLGRRSQRRSRAWPSSTPSWPPAQPAVSWIVAEGAAQGQGLHAGRGLGCGGGSGDHHACGRLCRAPWAPS